MKNKKVILLSGYSRGGTNIAWNLLQSHPEICSPVFETGKLFTNRPSTLSDYMYTVWNRLNLLNSWTGHRIIDSKLHNFKLLTLDHSDNRYKTRDSRYTKKEVARASLCLKSVDQDISYTDLLLSVYPDLYFLALTRNGYAFAEGHMRRGRSVQEAGRLYANTGETMRRLSNRIPHFRMVKFEDILQDPFGTAGELFNYVNVSPARLSELRIKSKKIISESDDHQVVHGANQKKYWFDRKTIGNILDPAINERQISRLSGQSIKDFNREARHTLEYFGYEVL